MASEGIAGGLWHLLLNGTVALFLFSAGAHFFSQNDGSWVTTSWKRLLYYTLTYIDMSVPGFGDEMSRLS